MQASSALVRQRAAAVGAAAAAAAACATLLLFDPNEPGTYPVCPFLAITGRWCPGCGSLRGIHALLTGDVVGAVGFNALMVATLPYLLYRWVTWFWPQLPRPGAASARLHPLALYSFPAVVVAFWALRNVPATPFTVLAP